MADQLYLLYWLRGFTEHNMLRHFERMLRLFPFSKLDPRATLRVVPIVYSGPPALEQSFPLADPGVIVASAREFLHGDSGYFVEANWDLWQFIEDWKLAPSRVTLGCIGSGFESEDGEHLRIDFGLDTLFLPAPDLPDSLVMARSNLRSLLHLVHELDNTLPVERRQLRTESGENFAERVQEAALAPTPDA